jgi:hypothetical protein
MLSRIRARLTYANVVATLALFVALGTGGAYAAASITGADVVDESLTGADVKGTPSVDGTLTGFDIQNLSIGTSDLAGSAVVAGKLGQKAVTGPKLADNAVTGAKVADGSLTGADIDESTFIGVMQGRSVFSRLVIPIGGALSFIGGSDLFFVGQSCSAAQPQMTFDNLTGETMDIVRQDSSTNTATYHSLDLGSSSNFRWNIDLPTGTNVQTFHISTPSGRTATVWASSAPRPDTNDCVETVQAVQSN